MTRKEHLLSITAEECNETAQRISKILRFGFSEIQPGHKQTNAERLTEEFSQLYGMFEMLQEEGHIQKILDNEEIQNKKIKVEKYLEYSKKIGTLTHS